MSQIWIAQSISAFLQDLTLSQTNLNLLFGVEIVVKKSFIKDVTEYYLPHIRLVLEILIHITICSEIYVVRTTVQSFIQFIN